MVRLLAPVVKLTPRSFAAARTDACTDGAVFCLPCATRETVLLRLNFARRAMSVYFLGSPAIAASRLPSSLLTAPPWDRRARPSEHKASRSARAVTADTEKREVNSRTVI